MKLKPLSGLLLSGDSIFLEQNDQGILLNFFKETIA